MAIVNSKSGLMSQLSQMQRSFRHMASLVDLTYKDADARARDGYSPSDIQNEMQARLDEVEDLADVVAADITALNFTFQSTYSAKNQGGANDLRILKDAYGDLAGLYSNSAVIEPADEGTTWYASGGCAFKVGDTIEIESAEDSSNDGVYVVDAVPPKAVTQYVRDQSMANAPYGSNLVTNGDFASDLAGWAGTNWAWNAGKAQHTAGNTDDLSFAGIDLDTAYQVVFTVSGRTAGSVQAFGYGAGGGYASIAHAADGTFTDYVYPISAGTGTLGFVPTIDFDGSIDNVVLKKIPWYPGINGAALWTLASGVATKSAGTDNYLLQPIANMAATPGTNELCHVSFDVTRTAGTLAVTTDAGGHTLTVSATGSYDFVTPNSFRIQFYADAAFAGTVSNVSVIPLRGIALRSAMSANNSADTKMKITLLQR